MKIAIAGKGGSGKTTLGGTLARVFAEKGYSVIAVDSDPSMNLHTSLGLENPTPVSQLKQLINERAVIGEGIYSLNPKVDDIPERYAARRGRLRLLVMGTVERGGRGCICPESTFLRALLRHLVLSREEVLILDTEAGFEHLGRKVAESFDLMLVVVEPSMKAVETARHIIKLARDIGIKKLYAIANKIASGEQRELLERELEVEILEHIPFDTKVMEADMKNVPLAEQEGSEALEKIVGVAGRLEELSDTEK